MTEKVNKEDSPQRPSAVWLLESWQRDARLWLAIMLLLTLNRAIFTGWFAADIDSMHIARDIALSLLHGARFDGRFALIAAVPAMFLAPLAAWYPGMRHRVDGIRLAAGTAMMILTLLLGAVNIGYMHEFHAQFNDWIFGLIYDDGRAIIATVWHQYPIIRIGLILVLLAVSIHFLLKWWLQRPVIPMDWIERGGGARRTGMLLLCIGLFLFATLAAAFGTVGVRPLSRRDTAKTGSVFLNSLIYNPYYAIYSVCRNHWKRRSARGLEYILPGQDIRRALTVHYPAKEVREPGSLLPYLHHAAAGPMLKRKPSHIFLVVMESQDAWPLLDRYKSLGVAPRLRKMAKDGVAVPAFVSAGFSTMPAMNTLILGTPEIGIETQYQLNAQTPYPTATAPAFAALGYSPHLYYGGFLSWRRLGEVAANQGFRVVEGAGSMGGATGANEWGVEDERLFDHVLSKLGAESSFNLILTTSNHPPFSIDCRAKGFPLDRWPDSLNGMQDGSMSLAELGHLWYGDHSMGKFVDEVLARYPDALIVLTGDHWSRRFPNGKPSLYERRAVPCIFYGPTVLAGLKVPERRAGSHIDIVPTLIELVAPKEFAYASLGGNMFDPGRQPLGLGANAAVTPGFIMDAPQGKVPYPVNESWFDATIAAAAVPAIMEQFQALHGIGWWMILKGASLDGADQLRGGTMRKPSIQAAR